MGSTANNCKAMNTRRILLVILGGFPGLAAVHADSTIDTVDRYSYGANIGWVNWKHDPSAPEGASLEPYLLRGRIYAANVGWIDLGDGVPDDGVFYSHTNGDWGVNHDGTGGLSGWAYGANIGWVRFDQGWKSPPRVDMKTGAMSGYAYGANVGWIGLDGLTTGVDEGTDSDGDGIADAWEFEMLADAGLTADLGIMDATSDSDGDGTSDLDEYAADTNPFDPGDWFRITSFVPDFTTSDVDLAWTHSPRRVYSVHSSTDLVTFVLEEDGILAGSTTLSMGSLPARLFFQVESGIPLAP